MLESLLVHYGYPILILGTFLEGETVMVLAGVGAQMGYLSLKLVILFGFSGTVLGDQIYFSLGRRYGKAFLTRKPSWQVHTDRVFTILEHHQNLLIVGFRFLYGIRTVTPFAIGMSQVSYLRFTILNLIGAGIWAIGIGLAGYYFGHAVEVVLGNIKQYEIEVMATLLVISVIIWLLHFYPRRRNRPSNTAK